MRGFLIKGGMTISDIGSLDHGTCDGYILYSRWGPLTSFTMGLLSIAPIIWPCKWVSGVKKTLLIRVVTPLRTDRDRPILFGCTFVFLNDEAATPPKAS